MTDFMMLGLELDIWRVVAVTMQHVRVTDSFSQLRWRRFDGDVLDPALDLSLACLLVEFADARIGCETGLDLSFGVV